MKKIALILAALMVFSTAEAKGIRIPRFKAPSFKSAPRVPKSTPRAPVRRAAPAGRRDTSDDNNALFDGFVGGAVGAVAVGVVFNGEKFTIPKAVYLFLIIFSVIMLKFS